MATIFERLFPPVVQVVDGEDVLESRRFPLFIKSALHPAMLIIFS